MLKMTSKRATLERLIAIHDQYESLRNEERELLGVLSAEDSVVKVLLPSPVLGPTLPPQRSPIHLMSQMPSPGKVSKPISKKGPQKGQRKSKAMLDRILENMPAPQSIKEITARLGLINDAVARKRVRGLVYHEIRSEKPRLQKVPRTKPVKFELRLPSSGKPPLLRLQVG